MPRLKTPQSSPNCINFEIRAYLKTTAGGLIVGRNGTTLKALQDNFNCKITMARDHTRPGWDRLVITPNCEVHPATVQKLLRTLGKLANHYYPDSFEVDERDHSSIMKVITTLQEKAPTEKGSVTKRELTARQKGAWTMEKLSSVNKKGKKKGKGGVRNADFVFWLRNQCVPSMMGHGGQNINKITATFKCSITVTQSPLMEFAGDKWAVAYVERMRPGFDKEGLMKFFMTAHNSHHRRCKVTDPCAIYPLGKAPRSYKNKQEPVNDVNGGVTDNGYSKWTGNESVCSSAADDDSSFCDWIEDLISSPKHAQLGYDGESETSPHYPPSEVASETESDMTIRPTSTPARISSADTPNPLALTGITEFKTLSSRAEDPYITYTDSSFTTAYPASLTTIGNIPVESQNNNLRNFSLDDFMTLANAYDKLFYSYQSLKTAYNELEASNTELKTLAGGLELTNCHLENENTSLTNKTKELEEKVEGLEKKLGKAREEFQKMFKVGEKKVRKLKSERDEARREVECIRRQ